MIVELGHFSLILALGLSFCLAVIPSWGVYKGNHVLMQVGPSIATGLFVMVGLSFLCLAYAFWHDDFSVAYVARNSNSALPVQYKLSAIWGAHEGSFLLWSLVMAGWTVAVAWFSGSLTADMRARVLSILGALSVGFLIFILVASNPFDRTLPVFPKDGSDLNPLLQDFGLIVHPPMLYMGYVGFAVPFAFAIATLTTGRLDSAWARWSRPWTNVAWAFLTMGIALGSWWAYYELGWGGWWFWDAVENASFMPWLIGTALIHSLSTTEKRGVFKSWTVLLAIFAFSFSLLGAFLVRSGVLTSVHAFAVDPRRGTLILIYLGIVIGCSLTLFAVKASGIKSDTGYEKSSREVLLLANNVLLVIATAAVLLGTLAPLGYEALTDGKKISVGPPYFNTVFVPVVMLLFLFMCLSPVSRWKKTPLALYQNQWKLVLGSFVTIFILLFALTGTISPMVLLVDTIALSIAVVLLADWWSKTANKNDRVKALFNQPMSYYGMMLGHFGIAVSMVGVCMTVYFSEEKDMRMAPGDSVALSGYEFRFNSMTKVKGPNYLADRGEIEAFKDGKSVALLHPEKRFYETARNMMTEADMDASMFRDLYVALGEPIDNTAWAVRIHYKPFVRWIWVGGLIMAIGGFVTVLDRRYRTVKVRAPATSIQGAVA